MSLYTAEMRKAIRSIKNPGVDYVIKEVDLYGVNYLAIELTNPMEFAMRPELERAAGLAYINRVINTIEGFGVDAGLQVNHK